MDVRRGDADALLERAILAERVAEKAACAASGAEALGRSDLADGLRRLARSSRVRGLEFRAEALASRLRGWSR